MSKLWNLSTQPEPFWLLEAMLCMNYVHVLDSEEWLNKSGSWSRRKKEEFLAPYRSFREEMRAKLQPILKQFPMVAGHVDPNPRKHDRESLRGYDSPIISFLVQMQNVLEAPERPTEEALEKGVNYAFGQMLGNDLQKSCQDRKIVIGSMEDVVEALEGWDGEDGDKFKILRLYLERREIMEQLWNLQEPCREIGRGCLTLVGERFDACMEKCGDQKEVNVLMRGVGVRLEEGCIIKITPMIMRYDGIMIQADESVGAESVRMNIHLGIETFYLLASKSDDLYNDDRLLAQLKALGDLTRLKILHLLVERPCYLQEMAKELELTPATVLHHLGILMEQELIEIMVTKEKKKIYYQLREQGLQEISRGIMQLALSRQERKEQQEKQIWEGQEKQGGWQWTIQK